jgi:hypothetical protein
MSDVRGSIEREMQRVHLGPFSVDDFHRRRILERRRERIGTVALAALIAISAVGLAARTVGFGTTFPAAGGDWSPVLNPAGLPTDERYRAVTYWNGMYVVAGIEHPVRELVPTLVTSTDATHWRRATLPLVNGMVTDLASDGRGRLLATVFDEKTDTSSIWITRDATTWRRADSPEVRFLIGISVIKDRYFAWGGDALLTSASGRRWTRALGARALGAQRSFISGVAAGVPGYLAWGQGGYASDGHTIAGVWTSPDGSSWSRVPQQASLEDASEMRSIVLADDGSLVGFGVTSTDPDGEPIEWRSSDGINWTKPSHGSGNPQFGAVIPVTDGFLSVGDGIWTSSDGKSWKQVTKTDGCWLYRVVEGPAGYVAVGFPADHPFDGPCMWTTASSS